jgi:hypothetical protein
MTSTTFEQTLERVAAGERLTAEERLALAASPDILQLAMIADAVRRRLHGSRATYVRVAHCGLDAAFPDGVPAGAREIRISGSPASIEAAVNAVAAVRAAAGERPITAFAWSDVERLAGGDPPAARGILDALRAAGLDALAGLALDELTDPERTLESLLDAGFDPLTVTVARPASSASGEAWDRASRLQARFGRIRALNPLPSQLPGLRPSTGYQDVRAVALARVTVPDIPSIQVDWTRYGPKLAQVALTFGADDVWGISASDAAPEGRRRAAVEEIRRNIAAAGFEPAERDGRYAVAS